MAATVAIVVMVMVVTLVVDHGERTSAPATSASTTSATTTSPTTTGATTTPTTAAAAPAVVVRRGPADRRIVALTFDAGSDTGYGSRILDTLAADGIHATFGMTGVWAEANPGLVRRMVAEGHQLVNHTYDHRSFTGRSPGTPPLSRSERLSELARAEAAVRTAGGVGMSPWFRPPYGDEDESVRVDAGAAGYQYELLWTVDSLGWKGVAPAEVTQRCLDAATPGAIYLMHVGVASTDHAALRALIDGLRSRGYTFATASELVAG